jgi:ADP-heptose:LPS heptosyltransferase
MKIGSVGDLNNIKKWQKNISDKYYTKLISASNKVLFEFHRNKEFFEKVLNKNIIVEKLFFLEKKIVSENKFPINYAVISPGASSPIKQWKINGFVEVCNYLIKSFGLSIVLVGDFSDKVLSNEIKAKVKSENIINKCGETNLVQLVRLVSNSKLVISNDSAVIHMTAAIGKRGICITRGQLFGRFNPYPKEICNNIKTIYPPDIMNNLDKFDCLSQKYKYGSDLDINSIRAEDVKESVTEVMVR